MLCFDVPSKSGDAVQRVVLSKGLALRERKFKCNYIFSLHTYFYFLSFLNAYIFLTGINKVFLILYEEGRVHGSARGPGFVSHMDPLVNVAKFHNVCLLCYFH